MIFIKNKVYKKNNKIQKLNILIFLIAGLNKQKIKNLQKIYNMVVFKNNGNY